jgi:alkaline phosphatase D
VRTDFVGPFTIGELEPGRRYGYRVLIDGKVEPVAQSLTFATQMLWQWRRDPPDWKLALGSCAYVNEAAYDRPGRAYGGPPEAAAIYDSIARQQPDAMLWAGDNVYYREADQDSVPACATLAHDRSQASLQRLLRHHFAIWDALRPEQQRQLVEGRGAEPSAITPTPRGLPNCRVRQFHLNDAEFFLDNRYYRDHDWLQADDRDGRALAGEERAGPDRTGQLVVVGSW